MVSEVTRSALTADQLSEVLARNRLWLATRGRQGERAVLRRVDLSDFFDLSH